MDLHIPLMVYSSGLLVHSGKTNLELCSFKRQCFKPAGSGHLSFLLHTRKTTAGSQSAKVPLANQGQRRERLVRKKAQTSSVVNIYLVRGFLFL